MDIASLQTFIAVAEQRSFSLAAERLFLTQPAVSKRIAALERELDASLFDRIGRQVHLTEAGNALLPRARRILEEVEDSRRAIANLEEVVSGRLTLGSSQHIGLHRLPRILRAYAARYPSVRLELAFMPSEEVCAAVEHGDLELGVITLPPEAPAPLEVTPLWPDPMVIMVAEEHPLSAAVPRHPRELAAWPALLPQPQTYTRELVDRVFQRAGVDLTAAQATDSLETLRVLAASGLGWSVLPETLLGPGLTVLPLKGFPITRTLGLVRHRLRTPSNAARVMADLLAEAATP